MITPAPGRVRARLVACTAFALVSFASNSVLCRMALGASEADPAAFTGVRLLSGALALWLLASTRRQNRRTGSPWISAFLLFAYAAAFSFAYLGLSVGTGALVLFGSVQATMLLAALRSGERPHPLQWAGLVLALAGLVVLVFPGLRAPAPGASALMAIAGISWGIYSLRGRGSSAPLADTARNFLLTLPYVALLVLLGLRSLHASPRGLALAVLSGAIASGVGYVAWYAALAGLTATRAATLQLTVPVLAACGGVVLLGESVGLRLLLAGAMILGGVGLAVGSGQARESGTRRAARRD